MRTWLIVGGLLVAWIAFAWISGSLLENVIPKEVQWGLLALLVYYCAAGFYHEHEEKVERRHKEIMGALRKLADRGVG